MRQTNSKGFTLIELLIVVAIIGIIAAIAIPNLLNAIDRGKQKRTMADLRTLGTANETYSIDNSFYPTATTIAGLATSVEPTYIRKAPINDGWSRTLVVNAAAVGYTLGSGGKNGGTLATVGTGGQTSSFDDAIIFINGQFTQWPEGLQQ
jgi:type II secretion system protein G